MVCSPRTSLALSPHISPTASMLLPLGTGLLPSGIFLEGSRCPPHLCTSSPANNISVARSPCKCRLLGEVPSSFSTLALPWRLPLLQLSSCAVVTHLLTLLFH